MLTMNGAGAAYASETVWNSGYQKHDPQWFTGADYWGSSGGISTVNAIPPYQQNLALAACRGSTTMRNVPDVALTAEDVWLHPLRRLRCGPWRHQSGLALADSDHAAGTGVPAFLLVE